MTRISGRSWTGTWPTASTATATRWTGRDSSPLPTVTPRGLAAQADATGFAGVTVYGVEEPGRPLRQEWANGPRREQILSASRAAEPGPSLTGFSDHLIAAPAKPWDRSSTRHSSGTQISLLGAAWTACRETATGAPSGGYRVSSVHYRDYSA